MRRLLLPSERDLHTGLRKLQAPHLALLLHQPGIRPPHDQQRVRHDAQHQHRARDVAVDLPRPLPRRLRRPRHQQRPAAGAVGDVCEVQVAQRRQQRRGPRDVLAERVRAQPLLEQQRRRGRLEESGHEEDGDGEVGAAEEEGAA